MKRVVCASALLVLATNLVGCGGGKSTPPPPQITVTVSPATVSVIAGQTQQFTATVSGASNTAVTWSLSGAGCTGTACGNIDSTGLYVAPSPIPATATVTVTATSSANTTKRGTATITHVPVTVAVSPSTLTLISADTRQFSATVSNVPGGQAGVTWSVAGGGTIDNAGLYTAPAKVVADTNVTVTATSQFDPTKATSVVFVIKAVVISVTPANVALEAGGAKHGFVATISNAPAGQNGVTWQLIGLGGIDTAGVYSSPPLVEAPTTDTVQAISVFDSTKVATATVSLTPIVVTVSPEAVWLHSGQTQQFTATVANHVNKAVTWSVSGTNCSGVDCGTVDASGLYTAPALIPSNVAVSVNATPVADSSRLDPATVNLIPVSVTLSPKTASVAVNATEQFTATVAGSSNHNITWSVSGSGCSGSACGTIATNGLYTAPGAVPSSTVTVQATSVADPAKSDTATVTISASSDAKLAGPYAFSYVGYDAAGRAWFATGSFVADGQGSLTGLMDANGSTVGSLALKTGFSGTYEVYAAGNRGQVVFNVPGTAMTFKFSMNSADSGHMIRFDSSGSYGSGSFKRQTTADFELSKLNGDYVLGLSGTNSAGNERSAAVGRLHTDGAGGISNTEVDSAEAAGTSQHFTFEGNFALNAATGAANGRGTLTMVVAGLGTASYSFYLVNQDEAFLLNTDPRSVDAPMLTGSMLRQTGGPFSTFSVQGTAAFYLVGSTMDNPRRPAVMVGQFGFHSGTGVASYTFNKGGTEMGSGGYDAVATVEANGRGVWTSASLGSHVFYLASPRRGFHMHLASPGTNVWYGAFEPQSGAPFSPDVFVGDFYGGTTLAPTSGLAYATGIVTADGNGGWTAISDKAESGIGLQVDALSAGTYSFFYNTGHGDWMQTSPSSFPKVGYAISPNKILFISVGPGLYPYFEIFEK